MGVLLLVLTSCDAPEPDEASTTSITFRNEPVPDAVCEPGTDCEGDAPYLHPFRDVELVDGQIPVLDIKDSPEGNRYMLFSSASQQAEDASVERYSASSKSSGVHSNRMRWHNRRRSRQLLPRR